MKNFTFNVRPFVRAWDDATIESLIDMVDHGINYWCSIAEDEPSPVEYPLLFVVTECETVIGQEAPRTHRIDMATIVLGLNRIMSYDCRVNYAALGHIASFVISGDVTLIDSEDVDLIVQAGLYNDIVWG